MLEVLPRLMSDCYQSDLFDDYSHFRGSFNPSLLYESYLGFSATLSPDERCVIHTIGTQNMSDIVLSVAAGLWSSSNSTPPTRVASTCS